jgi:sulfite reductase alpha subunit-like flavoprotein
LLGSKLHIEIQRGLLKLPPSINTPVICVGPGTGVAPMRAIIEERLHIGSQCELSYYHFQILIDYFAANTLYFGCRSATKDEHYADEWRRYSETCGLTYRVAHSRDGPEGVKRTYVQDLLEQDSYRIWKLLEGEKAWVYISGYDLPFTLA